MAKHLVLLVLEEIERALPNGAPVLHCQPKVNRTTWQVAGVESLLRWNPPDRIPSPGREHHPLRAPPTWAMSCPNCPGREMGPLRGRFSKA